VGLRVESNSGDIDGERGRKTTERDNGKPAGVTATGVDKLSGIYDRRKRKQEIRSTRTIHAKSSNSETVKMDVRRITVYVLCTYRALSDP